MREIPFRVKRLDNGEWVEGLPIHPEDTNLVWCVRLLSGEEIMIDRSTLCQFTGLRDRNGERIWESDRLSMVWYEGQKSEVLEVTVIFSFGMWKVRTGFVTRPFTEAICPACPECTRLGSSHDTENNV